jgi:hypothetical protein
MSTTRAEAIRQGEQLRSAIVSYIRSAKEPVTVSTLASAAAIRAHFLSGVPSPQEIDRHVRMLWKSGILSRIRINRPQEPNSQYGYEYVEESRRGGAQPASANPTAGPTAADVKVFATKSGTLRVSFRGLTIEIGVDK